MTLRAEDLLAILERLATPNEPIKQRKEMLRRRAEICGHDLSDPLRAFHEWRRILELDPVDWEPLEPLEKLADDHQLWPLYDATLAQLWDRATSDKDRGDLLLRRQRIAQRLERPDQAFEIAIRRFRLDPENVDLLRTMTEAAEALGAWKWLLPILEAAQLAPTERRSAAELTLTAALYEDKVHDKERASVLYADAFVMDPSAEKLVTKLDALAADLGRHDGLADTLRLAAAVSDDRDRKIELLRRVASSYERRLKQTRARHRYPSPATGSQTG